MVADRGIPARIPSVPPLGVHPSGCSVGADTLKRGHQTMNVRADIPVALVTYAARLTAIGALFHFAGPNRSASLRARPAKSERDQSEPIIRLKLNP